MIANRKNFNLSLYLSMYLGIYLSLPHGVDALMLNNFDLIIISYFCYFQRPLSIFLLVFYALFKDFILWNNFYGISLLQFSSLYVFLRVSQSFYNNQTFNVVWLHFASSSLIFSIIQMGMSALYMGHWWIQPYILQCLSTILWFPLITYCCTWTAARTKKI